MALANGGGGGGGASVGNLLPQAEGGESLELNALVALLIFPVTFPVPVLTSDNRLTVH